jgi:hypothetical protein
MNKVFLPVIGKDKKRAWLALEKIDYIDPSDYSAWADDSRYTLFPDWENPKCQMVLGGEQ